MTCLPARWSAATVDAGLNSQSMSYTSGAGAWSGLPSGSTQPMSPASSSSSAWSIIQCQDTRVGGSQMADGGGVGRGTSGGADVAGDAVVAGSLEPGGRVVLAVAG